MKKLTLALCILGLGAMSFGALHHAMTASRDAAASHLNDLAEANDSVAQLQSAIDSLRQETSEKQRFLTRQTSADQVRRDLLDLLENPGSKHSPSAWTDLRRELGIGWDSSSEYVLVSKRVLKRVGLHAFSFPPAITAPMRAALAISRSEESQIKATIEGIKSDCPIHARRLEPAGDLLAHYILEADDNTLEQSISNRFSAGVIAALEAERADFFVDDGWRALRANLPMVGSEPITFTVKRAPGVDQQRFIWEIQKAGASSSGEVRYAQHPAHWFSLLFPRGWREVAELNSFQLPQDFEKGRDQ